MGFIHVDTSFLPFKEQSFIENIIQISENTNEKIDSFSIDVLRSLSRFVSSGISDFTFQIIRGEAVSVWPRNTLHRLFNIYIFFEKNKIRFLLFDKNAACTVRKHYIDTDINEQDQSVFFKEKDFFRKKLQDYLLQGCMEIIATTNISISEICGLRISGIPEFLFLLFDFRPPVKNEYGFLRRFPVLNASDIGFEKISNAIIETDEINLNSINMLFVRYFTFISENDFIYINEDFISGYSGKERRLYYIEGITENSVQEKITDSMKNNVLGLPLNLFTAGDTDYEGLVRWMDLSDYTFSDNIEKDV